MKLTIVRFTDIKSTYSESNPANNIFQDQPLPGATCSIIAGACTSCCTSCSAAIQNYNE